MPPEMTRGRLGGAGPREQHTTESQHSSKSAGSSQDRSSLYAKAESLGAACAICLRIAESLTGDKSAGAVECVIALRTEVARLLAIASRPA